MIEGYKAFYKELINSYGQKFEVGHYYEIDTNGQGVKYGNDGIGYHFCKNLEDCLRFFDGLNQDIAIAKVLAIGENKEWFDNYYGYYDVYVTSHMYIEHLLNRKEIIEYALKLHPCKLRRFIQGYRLTEEEMSLLIENDSYGFIKKDIRYYQLGDKNAYVKRMC